MLQIEKSFRHRKRKKRIESARFEVALTLSQIDTAPPNNTPGQRLITKIGSFHVN